MRRVETIYQTQSAECGLACLAMVAKAHGFATDLRSMRLIVGSYPRGMNARDLTECAAHLRLRCRVLRLEVEDLSCISLPAVVHWDLNHFVVLEKTSRRGFTIHDPATGKHSLTITEFAKRFTGVAFEFERREDFVESRLPRKNILWGLWCGEFDISAPLYKLFAISILLEVCSLASPFVIQVTTDKAIPSMNRSLLALLACACMWMIFMQAAASALRQAWIERLRIQLNAGMTGFLFARLMTLPFSFFQSRHHSDIQSRFGSLDAIHAGLSSSIVAAFLDALVGAVLIVIMLKYNVALSLLTIGFGVIYCAMRWYLHSPMIAAFEETIVAGTKKTGFLSESIRGIEVLKVYASSTARESQFGHVLSEYVSAQVKLARNNVRFRFLANLILGSSFIGTIWMASIFVINGAMTIGMMFAFLSFRTTFTNRLVSSFDSLMQIKLLNVHANRVSDITLEEGYTATTNSLAFDGNSRIVLENVFFRYPGTKRPVISNLTAEIIYRESVAITGPSGCGKTTLARLILGLQKPVNGRVTISGKEVTNDFAAQLHSMAYVSQSDALFSGSILENVALWATDIDPDKARLACERAAVWEDIDCMPMGIETLVGDGGGILSGGQRQRLLIARALYSEPKILLLDEATSHLDLATERLLLENLSKLDMTRIHIAHRPQTIEFCDKVIALSMHPGCEITSARRRANSEARSIAT